MKKFLGRVIAGFSVLASIVMFDASHTNAQAASCTIPASGNSLGVVYTFAGTLACGSSPTIGASIANKVLINVSSSGSATIAMMNASGRGYARPVTSLSVSGSNGEQCTSDGVKYTCRNLTNGSVITFTDTSLSTFGTLHFTWKTLGSANVKNIGTISNAPIVAPSSSKGLSEKEKIAKDIKQKSNTFMQSRSTMIMHSQPSLSGFLDGSNFGGGGPLGSLNLNGTTNNLQLGFSSSLSRIRAAHNQVPSFANGSVAKPAKPAEAEHALGYAGPAAQDRASSAIDDLQSGGKAAEKKQADTRPNTRNVDFPNGRFDIWTEVYASHTKNGGSRADLMVGYLGSHYFVTPNLLIGAMAQIDQVDEKNGASQTEGTGWMAGPYIAGRLPNQEVFYEARFAWGQSNNTIKPNATTKGKFDTERWMASAKVSGNYVMASLDDATRAILSPVISAAYFTETRKAFRDSVGNNYGAQTSSMGEMSFGPKVSIETLLDNGWRVTPSFATSGMWTFAKSGAAAGGLKEGDIRARLDAGLTLMTDFDWLFSFNTYYDGIGIEDYESYGGRAKLTIPLN